MKGYVPPNKDDNKLSVMIDNDIRILSADYLFKTYRAKEKVHQNITEDLVRNFSLNEEQE